MIEKKTEKRKWNLILALLCLLLVVFAALFIKHRQENVRTPLDNAPPFSEWYPDQVYLDAEESRAFLARHEQSFNTMITEIGTYREGRNGEIFFVITYDEDGQLDIIDALADSEAFVSAVQEIASDELFRTNYFGIQVSYDAIELPLYINEKTYTRSGIVYHWDEIEPYEDGWEKTLDAHWLWYNYPMV